MFLEREISPELEKALDAQRILVAYSFDEALEKSRSNSSFQNFVYATTCVKMDN